MKCTRPKINTLFRLGLLCLMIKTIFGSSNILRIEGIADDVISVLGAAFLLLSVMKKGCKPITYVVYMTIVGLAAYTSYRIGNLRIIMVVALCVAANRQDIDKTIKFLFVYETFFLLFHVFAAVATSAFGKNNFVYMSGQMKYTFGFGHPNTFSCLLTNVLLMWSWLNYDRLRISHVFAQIFIVLFFYAFTGTRTILLSIFIFVALLCYMKVTRYDLHLIVRYIIPVAVICHIAAIFMFLAGHPVAIALNKLLSTRIKLGAYWYTLKGFSLFGQNVQGTIVEWDEVWQLAGEIPFDNIYTYLFMNIGFAWLAVLGFFFYRLSFKKNAKYNLFLIMWALYGVTEVHGINPVMLFPLLLLASNVRAMNAYPEAPKYIRELKTDQPKRKNEPPNYATAQFTSSGNNEKWF